MNCVSGLYNTYSYLVWLVVWLSDKSGKGMPGSPAEMYRVSEGM